MANPIKKIEQAVDEFEQKVNNKLSKVGDVVESIFSKGSLSETEIKKYSTQGQTCLEAFGIAARKVHLNRNEWYKDLQYTKPLINSEYEIQTEFKVYSSLS